MPETQPATIAEAIRDRRSYIAYQRDRGRYFISADEVDQPVGEFLALSGAVVAVAIRSKFSGRQAVTGGEEHVVEFSVIAKCAGFGCIDPKHTVTSAEKHPLTTDADETGKAPFLLTGDALKWAQSHAETCRAMPKPGGGSE
ncbi:hypothetical protein ACFXA3_00340 [Streptomyces sp. NPDC059456]|uniref:hypothetical protein n=1 Tax=Streptomyces sp. NPDC059456 TaxID=3346838 RepID=UPI00368F6473